MDRTEETEWKPNEELVEMLMNMGISKIAAEQALFYTGNSSVEAAASFVFDSPEQGDEASSQLTKAAWSTNDGSDEESDAEQGKDSDAGYKMVFIVNSSLNMGAGKMAAQVAHASLGLYRSLLEYDEMVEALDHWTERGQKKIVLKGENHIHLQELQTKADQNHLPSFLVQDAGRTQIPADSTTVLGLFGIESMVNAVSGNLKLL